MWKSIVYKEWLKVKWVLILFTLMGVLVIAFIFIKVQHDFKFNTPKNYWYSILFQGFKYFSLLKFIPIPGGLAFGIAQFFPETINKRIKLSFHLPINENRILLMMILFGTICLLVSFISMATIFYGLSTIYFPSNILWPAFHSIVPWFLSGLAVYYFVALIVMEPVWKYRFLYLIVSAPFLSVYLEKGLIGAYAPANLVLIGLTIVLSISLLFSGHRFRKGEM